MTQAALLDAVPSPARAEDQDDAWARLVGTALADPAVPFEQHWRAYQKVFARRGADDGPPVAWRPDAATVEHANVTRLARTVGVEGYDALHAWSVASREAFWSQAIQQVGVPFRALPGRVLDDSGGPEHPTWLPGATLNAAELCFLAPESQVAIRFAEAGAVHEVTYADLRRRVDAVSHALGRLGLRPGDAVALYTPMTVSCVAWYLGIVQAGLVVVSIPDSFAPPEVATRLRLADAQAVFTVRSFRRAGRDVPLAPKAEEAVRLLGRDVRVLVEGESVDGTPWMDVVADAGPFEPVACAPDDTTNVLFSSGTTGEPKAIPWTHCTPLKACIDGHLHQDIHPGDVVAWPTNVGWMMGPWLIYAALGNRATIALHDDVPTSTGFVAFVRDAGVTMLGVVPAVVRGWRAAGVLPHSLPGVRVFSSTGEASNPSDYLYLMSLAGYRAPVVEYCGGTEIGGGHLTGTVVQPASPATFSTPALGIDFVLLDDQGRAVDGPGMGELFLLPPSLGLSQRLLNRDHHEVYFEGCPPGPGGAVLRRHGDEVERLARGFYRAQGRADDTMNLGGIKVGSVELETVMNVHPAVLETAAVAVPPPGGGADRLVVFAVLDPSAPGPTLSADDLRAALQDLIKSDLNPLFRIHDVVVVERLPRTASNKVMRRELRAGYA